MEQKFDHPINELKFHLTLQLEAYHNEDWLVYKQLERKILEIERKL
jgi:hypothetical protein